MQFPSWTHICHEARMLLSLKSELILCFATHVISLYDAGISVKKMQHCLGKNDTSWQSKCCFHLTLAWKKTCNIEANTTLSFEYGATGQNWNPIISDIHKLNTNFHSKHFCTTVYFSPTVFFLPAVTMVLLFRSLSFNVAWCASYCLINCDHCI